MREVCLVGCAKSKRDVASRPRDLCMPSDLFKKTREYCELYHDDWYILSAKHFLLDPDGTPIEPYDETLRGAPVKRKRMWSSKVFKDLEEEGLLSEKILIHAGMDYYKYLIPYFDERDVVYEIPTKGLGIGEKKAWYKAKINAFKKQKLSTD